MTAPLNAFMSLLHAFDWLGPRKPEVKAAYLNWLQGTSGNPIDIARTGLSGSVGGKEKNKHASKKLRPGVVRKARRRW